MSSIRWNMLDRAMATAELKPAIDWATRSPWLPRNVDEKALRMNWAVVTVTDGARQIRMNWDLTAKDD